MSAPGVKFAPFKFVPFDKFEEYTPLTLLFLAC